MHSMAMAGLDSYPQAAGLDSYPFLFVRVKVGKVWKSLRVYTIQGTCNCKILKIIEYVLARNSTSIAHEWKFVQKLCEMYKFFNLVADSHILYP